VGPNGSTEDVYSLAEAAAYLRLPKEEVLRMTRVQGLPARQVGSEWRFLKAAIQDWLRTSVAPKSNKDAWLELAGVWKDDPYLERMLEMIQQRRQRTAEAES
jgi:excisionase family DNA binding protein